jgi:hypothetical protein
MFKILCSEIAVAKMIIDLQDVTLCMNAGLRGRGEEQIRHLPSLWIKQNK